MLKRSTAGPVLYYHLNFSRNLQQKKKRFIWCVAFPMVVPSNFLPLSYPAGGYHYLIYLITVFSFFDLLISFLIPASRSSNMFGKIIAGRSLLASTCIYFLFERLVLLYFSVNLVVS